MKYFFHDMKVHAISVDQECSANWVGRYILVQIHDAKFNLGTAEEQAFLICRKKYGNHTSVRAEI